MLVFLRHGIRQYTHEALSSEPSLSSLGQMQAWDMIGKVREDFASQPNKKNLPPPGRLLSSPKIRCQQTLTPMSKHFGLKLEVMDILDERHPHESEKVLRDRVQEFLIHIDKY